MSHIVTDQQVMELIHTVFHNPLDILAQYHVPQEVPHETHALFVDDSDTYKMSYCWRRNADDPVGTGAALIYGPSLLESNAWQAFRHLPLPHISPTEVPTTGSVIVSDDNQDVRLLRYSDGSFWASHTVRMPTYTPYKPKRLIFRLKRSLTGSSPKAWDYTTEEATELLGCTESSVKRAMKSLKLEVIQRSGKLRFTASQIDQIRVHRARR